MREIISKYKTVVTFFHQAVVIFINITQISRFWSYPIQPRSLCNLFIILEYTVNSISIIRINRISFFDNCINIGPINPFNTTSIYYLISSISTDTSKVQTFSNK